jgi:hypothetical protein
MQICPDYMQNLPGLHLEQGSTMCRTIQHYTQILPDLLADPSGTKCGTMCRTVQHYAQNHLAPCTEPHSITHRTNHTPLHAEHLALCAALHTHPSSITHRTIWPNAQKQSALCLETPGTTCRNHLHYAQNCLAPRAGPSGSTSSATWELHVDQTGAMCRTLVQINATFI